MVIQAKYTSERLSSKLSIMFILRINMPRKEGGLGHVNIPLLSDITHQISRDYGVYLEDLGHTLRWEACLKHIISLND